VPVIGRTAVILIVVLLGSLSVYTSSDAFAGAVEVSGAVEAGGSEEGAGDVPLVFAHPAKSPITNTNAISNLGNDFFSITLFTSYFLCCLSI
jgi:hypothetical protein